MRLFCRRCLVTGLPVAGWYTILQSRISGRLRFLDEIGLEQMLGDGLGEAVQLALVELLRLKQYSYTMVPM